MKSIFDEVNNIEASSTPAEFHLDKNDDHKNKVLLFLSILGSGNLDNLLPYIKNGDFSLDFKVPALSLPKEIKKAAEEFLGYFLGDSHNLSLASIFVLSNRIDLLNKSLPFSEKEYKDDELLRLVSKLSSSHSSNKIMDFNLVNIALYYDNLEIIKFYKKHTQVENHNMLSDFYYFIKIKEQTNNEGLSKDIYPKNVIHYFIDQCIIPFRQSKNIDRSTSSSMNSLFSQGFLEERIIKNNDYEAFKKLSDIGHFKNKKTLRNIFSGFIPRQKEKFLKLYQWYYLNQHECKQKKPLLLDIFNEDFNSKDVDFWREIFAYKEIRQDFIKQAQNKEGEIKLVPSLGHAVQQLNVLDCLEEKDLIDRKFIDQKIWSLFTKTMSKRIQETLFFSRLVEYDGSYSELFDRYELFEKMLNTFYNDQNFSFKDSKNFSLTTDNLKWQELWQTRVIIDKALNNPLNMKSDIEKLSDKYIFINEINPQMINKNFFFKHLSDTLDKDFSRELDFVEGCFDIYEYMAEKEKPLLKKLNEKINLAERLSKKIAGHREISEKDKIEKQKIILETSLFLKNNLAENKKSKRHKML